VVHKNQVKRSITLSKASPGEYSTYIYVIWSPFSLFYASDVLCITYRVLG
jgi:hypothetical protein